MLRTILKDNGWKPTKQSRVTDPRVETWSAEHHRHILVIERAPDDRPETVRGRLALALLHASRLVARDSHTAGVVTMKHLSRTAIEGLSEMVAGAAPTLGWAAVGDNGRAIIRLHNLVCAIEPRERSQHSQHESTPVDPFSDRGLWITKVLIKRTLETANRDWDGWMTGPTAYFGTYDAFAEAVGVSTKTVWQTIHALAQLGFVAGAAAAVPLVRVDELLDRIHGATRKARKPVPCRWLLPRRDSLHRLLADRLTIETEFHRGTHAIWREGREPICLASFSAARAHKLSITSVRAEHLHVAKAARLVDLGLVAAEPGEQPDVIVHRPLRPDSIFRAAVLRDGLPCADLVQTWLDVIDHPDRGAEQAARIHEELFR